VKAIQFPPTITAVGVALGLMRAGAWPSTTEGVPIAAAVAPTTEIARIPATMTARRTVPLLTRLPDLLEG
jgi:hypothetical protein